MFIFNINKMKTKNTIQTEALKKINNQHRVGLGISVGVGKTLIGLKHFNKLQKENKNGLLFAFKALVVAPKKSIFESWKEDAKKFNLEYLLKFITFTTYLSLTKQDLDYDVIYLDECHSLLNNHRKWLDNYTGKIIGLTGTPPKQESSEKGKMIKKYCPIIFQYITDDAIDDEILNDYNICIHLLELDDINNIKIEKGNRKWYTSEQKQYNYWTNRYIEADSPKERQIVSIMRMKAMQTFPSKEEYAKTLLEQSDNKCILFANEQKQADKLCEYSYHSNNLDSEGNLELFKKGVIKKLSCVLQLSEGINIPHLKEGIIMHAYGNNRKSSQRIGRLLRLNPNDTASVHILCYKETIDEKWIKNALESFDNNKIKWYDPHEF